MSASRLKGPDRRKGAPRKRRTLKELHREFHIAGSVLIVLAMLLFLLLSFLGKRFVFSAVELRAFLLISVICLAVYNLLTLIVFLVLRAVKGSS